MTQPPLERGHYSQIVNATCDRLAASGGRFDVTALHDRLNDLAKDDPEDATLRALVHACAYRLTSPSSEAMGACGPFAPMWRFGFQRGVSVARRVQLGLPA